jgi:hypothetical protein
VNSPPPADWSDLAAPWHAEGTTVSREDIAAHLVRRRRQLLMLTLVELLVGAMGVAAALWLAFMPRLRWMGLLIIACSLGSAVLRVRARRRREPAGTADLLSSLRESIAYQEWLAHELGFGRAMLFITLLPIVSVLSVLLRDLHGTTPFGFVATAVAATSALAALAWNLVLTRRTRRCSARLRDIAARLAP